MENDQLVGGDQEEKTTSGAKSGSDFEVSEAGGDISNVKKEGDKITFDIDLNYPSAVQPSASGISTSTTPPTKGSGTTTVAPAQRNDAASQPVTDNPYQHPDAETPEDRKGASPNVQEAAQGTANPPQLNPEAQQGAAGEVQSDQQKKPDEKPAEESQALQPITAENDQKAPPLKDAVEGEGSPDNLMKGDIGDVAEEKKPGQPPQLSEGQQQDVAADNAAKTQAQEQAQKSSILAQADQSSSEKLGGKNGNLFSSSSITKLASFFPPLKFMIRKVEEMAAKNTRRAIVILSKVKRMLETAKTVVSVGEAFGMYGKSMVALCATGLGIFVAIIIAIPYLFIMVFMAISAPNVTSKTAKTIDEFIKKIDAVLIKLKKYYNTQQQKKAAEILKKQEIEVNLRNQNVQQPPGPS